MTNKLRLAIPYSGIPLLGLALLFFHMGLKESFYLLQQELLIIFGYIIALSDLKTKTIPNIILLIMLAGWIIIFIPQLLLNTNNIILYLKDSLFGFVSGGGIFLLVYLFSRRGLGGGDVKFMAVSGLYLGFSLVIPAMLYGTILAGLSGLLLIMLKKIKLKDSLPLAPFLYIGILLAIFFL
ncbi:MAG: prepilin peptidase [Firmicutes bacterium]|nr:prepilin peptidase [Bacillota bacterium]